MSIVRMSPELIACIETGAVVRIVEGGAPLGARVSRAWLEWGDVAADGWRAAVAVPKFVCVEVDDGIDGDRVIVFERLEAES